MLCTLLQSCELPRNGPLLREVKTAGEQSQVEITPVTPEAVAAGREATVASFPPSFLAGAPIDYEKIVPGDELDLSIWERDGLQMFPAGPNGASDLGIFTVGADGTIDLPYVGSLQFAGLTPAKARTLVMRRLKGLVIASDARVAFTVTRGNLVTIQGDVTKPGVYPVGQGMLKLGEALALAAPDQTGPEQTTVTVRRDGVVATVRLSDVYRDPAQDIALRAGDSIVINALQQFVTVVGAAGIQGRVKITKRDYSVLDALADSKGMIDSLADPRALFLLRARSEADGLPSAVRPLVYQFDMRRPDQILLAKQLAVGDGDVLFVSDAPYTQVQKMLAALSASLGAVRGVAQ